MLGANRDHDPAVCIHDDTGDVGRLLGRCLRFEVNTGPKPGDQLAAFRVQRQVQRLQQDRDGLCRRLDDPAVLDDQSQRSLAAGDFRR